MSRTKKPPRNDLSGLSSSSKKPTKAFRTARKSCIPVKSSAKPKLDVKRRVKAGSKLIY
jgi:hypothetical protein